MNMPFVLTNLQTLTLDGFNEFKGPLNNFIKQNEGIKHLDLIPCFDDWDDMIIDLLASIVGSLPNLVELTFQGDTSTIDDIIQFLNVYKNLQIVRVLFPIPPNWPAFAATMGVKWTVEVYHIRCVGGNMICYAYKLDRNN